MSCMTNDVGRSIYREVLYSIDVYKVPIISVHCSCAKRLSFRVIQLASALAVIWTQLCLEVLFRGDYVCPSIPVQQHQ